MSEVSAGNAILLPQILAHPAEAGTPEGARRLEAEAAGPSSFATLLAAALSTGAVSFEREAPAAAGEDEPGEWWVAELLATLKPKQAAQLNQLGGEVEAAMPGPHTDRPMGSASPLQALENVGQPDPDPSKLDPEFKARLERVIQRMEQEFGHRVQLVETLRPQARQDFLFEQGRSRPGPIVTWTRNSKHTVGQAADVLVDGTYDNPQGYARLAQIAREEGLRTLGPRDLGHVELAHDRAAPVALRDGPQPHRIVQEPMLPHASQGKRSGAIALADVAPVATVAEVAEVARVASVAAAAVRSDLARHPTPAEAPTRDLAQSFGDVGGVEEPLSGADSSGNEGRTATLHSSVDFGGRAGLESFAERLQAASGAGSVERVARLLEIRQADSMRSPTQVVLRLDDAGGEPTRIRVGLRGNAVDATIDLSNEAAVEELRTQMGDLAQALGRRGLDAEGLQIRLARPIADAQELVATLAARGQASSEDGKESGFERRRGNADPASDDPRDRESRDRRDYHSSHEQGTDRW